MLVQIFILHDSQMVLLYNWFISLKAKKNVAIANALQLEVARATSALFRFTDDVMRSLTSLNLSIAVL